jgi:hypothetical protein
LQKGNKKTHNQRRTTWHGTKDFSSLDFNWDSITCTNQTTKETFFCLFFRVYLILMQRRFSLVSFYFSSPCASFSSSVCSLRGGFSSSSGFGVVWEGTENNFLYSRFVGFLSTALAFLMSHALQDEHGSLLLVLNMQRLPSRTIELMSVGGKTNAKWILIFPRVFLWKISYNSLQTVTLSPTT